MLCSLRSDHVVSLLRRKGCIKGAETCPTVIYRFCMRVWKSNKSCATYFAPAALQGAQISSVNEACIHCFCPVCVSATPCFDFGLASVLGIAFGGFLIGVLLIGALWFIKIKTGKTTAQSWSINTGSIIMSCGIKLITFWFKQATQAGWTLAPLQQVSPVRLRFFRGFLFPSVSSHKFPSLLPSGCPCSGAKRQPVSSNPSPSENSSANASIGSTQSTPTSSMAWFHLSNLLQPAAIFVKVSYVGFVSYWLMLEKHSCCPLCVLFKFSFKKHKPGLPCEPKMEVK